MVVVSGCDRGQYVKSRRWHYGVSVSVYDLLMRSYTDGQIINFYRTVGEGVNRNLLSLLKDLG